MIRRLPNQTFPLSPAVRTSKALLVGAMVPVGAVLSVHSVFDKAVNLEQNPVSPLISLVVRPEDMAATALLVDHLFDRPAVGAPVVIGLLKEMDTAPTTQGEDGALLRAACEGSTGWDGRLSMKRGYTETPRVESLTALVALLEGLVVEHGRDGGLLALVSAAELTPVSRFARAAIEKSGTPDWHRLVGLGIGLTPSGDDFLTGALLAECLLVARCSHPHPRGTRRADAPGAPSGSISVDRSTVAARLGGTTAAGRTLLAAALEERFPAYLLNLVETAIEGGTLSADLLDHGHSSATDAVCGIIVRLRMEC